MRNKFKTFDDYVRDRMVHERVKLDLSKGIFYWSYGSNLSKAAMARRCPGAIPIQPLTLNNGALVFRGVADVVTRSKAKVHGGLWWINHRHEETLDTYEGVRSKFYLKRYLKLKFKGIDQPFKCLYYVMAMRRGIDPPSESYLACIAEGYHDFGLPMEALDKALQEAWEDKTVTPYLRERRKRRGGKLAQSLPLGLAEHWDTLGLPYGAHPHHHEED